MIEISNLIKLDINVRKFDSIVTENDIALHFNNHALDGGRGVEYLDRPHEEAVRA